MSTQSDYFHFKTFSVDVLKMALINLTGWFE